MVVCCENYWYLSCVDDTADRYYRYVVEFSYLLLIIFFPLDRQSENFEMGLRCMFSGVIFGQRFHLHRKLYNEQYPGTWYCGNVFDTSGHVTAVSLKPLTLVHWYSGLTYTVLKTFLSLYRYRNDLKI
jgi:hypothetical protein